MGSSDEETLPYDVPVKPANPGPEFITSMAIKIKLSPIWEDQGLPVISSWVLRMLCIPGLNIGERQARNSRMRKEFCWIQAWWSTAIWMVKLFTTNSLVPG